MLERNKQKEREREREKANICTLLLLLPRTIIMSHRVTDYKKYIFRKETLIALDNERRSFYGEIMMMMIKLT